MCNIMVRIVNFSVKASDVSHPHKMNHGVSEEHQVHTSASDTLVILLQVHLESFFKTFKRWDLKKEQNKIVESFCARFDKNIQKKQCEELHNLDFCNSCTVLYSNLNGVQKGV